MGKDQLIIVSFAYFYSAQSVTMKFFLPLRSFLAQRPQAPDFQQLRISKTHGSRLVLLVSVAGVSGDLSSPPHDQSAFLGVVRA